MQGMATGSSVHNHAVRTSNHDKADQQSAIFSFQLTNATGDFTDSFPNLLL